MPNLFEGVVSFQISDFSQMVTSRSRRGCWKAARAAVWVVSFCVLRAHFHAPLQLTRFSDFQPIQHIPSSIMINLLTS